MSEIYSAPGCEQNETEIPDNRKILGPTHTPRKDISPEIIKGLREGDPEAFKTIYMRFYEPLADFLSALIHNPAEGEELAQETMIQLWENRDKIDPAGNLSGYIYTIGRNVAL